MLNAFEHALVTGASGGIGRALCHALDRQGVPTITLVGRRQSALHDVAGSLSCRTNVRIADLSRDNEVASLVKDFQDIDLLINNAGFGSFGPFASLDPQNQIDMVSVNCSAPVALAAAYLPQMLQRKHGCVVNIASGMAYQPMPFMSTYAASKAFLLHWGEGVSEELKGTGVSMVNVCPGTVHTGFAAAGNIPLDQIAGVSLVTVSIDAVVKQTISAIEHRTCTVTPGIGNRLGACTGRLVPRGLVRTLLGYVMRRNQRVITG